MELVFVRHGQPAWVVDGLADDDPGLTPLGRDQAEAAADRLAAERQVAEILVSPARRSRETAGPLARRTGLEPHVVADLVELRTPVWQGQPAEVVEQAFRDAAARPPAEWWDGLPGGESFHAFHDRIAAAMETLLAERGVTRDPGIDHVWRLGDDPERIVIVAHAGTNAVALGWLLGLEPTPWEWERFVLGHASLARVRAIPLAGGHVFSLRTFNDREHLATGQRSR